MRVFYAADIHGSEACWRKFLNAGRFYKADALVMGGDLVAKALVPITVSQPGVASVIWGGKTQSLDGEPAITAFEKVARGVGFYPARISPEESAVLADDEAARVKLFEDVIRRELLRWIDIAEDKQPTAGIYLIAGNDDPWFIDDIMTQSATLTYCDGQIVTIGDHEMLNLGYSNETPWHTHRELAEDDLLARIDDLASQLAEPSRAIFNVHVPPYASGLDEAPLLSDDFRPRTRLGQVETGPVGSTAVRKAIETYHPMLGLHGHIHESRGIATIDHTLVINPGSEYSSGRIHGALFELSKGQVRRRQLVIG